MSDTDDLCNSNDFSNVPEGFKLIGNRIFNEGKYLLPNDTEEASRLDLQHYILRAPVEDSLRTGIKVLDVGCGSGKWVVEMAETYPNSTFVGTDIADVFPRNGVPSNASFQQLNTLDGLPFPDANFDYVFQRFLLLALTPADWAVAVREMVRVTKPGGWVEFFEFVTRWEQPPPDTSLWEISECSISRLSIFVCTFAYKSEEREGPGH
ncbi:S-adenosyl-L-methionine-dependent methyltransferase [Endogone sp. FLAS-F59071]|nr:S-adenosyl-L-methionine-dependent methyltransferase [Endogone sp. FLAS-F59071]|eukprot:RUS18723.1 S-adenosyl-L-methionine-dependent methyltransferase [Endogone sp. FLAS-F59071]